jgi:ABC-2 type transport system permease protein
MLMAVKNQLRVILLSLKYNIMREMTNRFTFFTNVGFMVFNNSTFIIQWLLLFHLKENIGGYTMSDVMVLWGLAASTYGLSHLLFERAYSLPDLIINGKLDSFLVQPKNVLLSVISSGTNTSAIGDLLYGYLVLCIFKFSFSHLFLFTLFTITGSMIITGVAIIVGSFSFWIVKGDMVSDSIINIMINFSTYPDGIFKGMVRLLLYTLIPVGLMIYLPMRTILQFDLANLTIILIFTLFITTLAFIFFYRGLKRYSSSNLMSARM